MGAYSPYQHWRLDIDAFQIACVTLDRQGERVNTLSMAMFEEFEALLTEVSQQSLKGLILLSGKDTGFVLGADVREFETLETREAVTDTVRRGLSLLDKLEALPFPTVAAIDGLCLGGGVELALACDYRIAVDKPQTKLGLPEVKLGLYPGLGGTVRLTRLIGGPKAMELMLTGRMLNAKRAKAAGLVDLLIDTHQSPLWQARRVILKKRKSRHPTALAKLTNSAPARSLIAPMMRKKTAEKARREHYPSPFALIDLWQQHGGDAAAMQRAETEGFAELMLGPTSKGLRRVFHLMEGLKQQGKNADFRARRVHVIGAGVMGGDIATWCASQGLEVTLQDRSLEQITPALVRAKKYFKKRLKTPLKVNAAVARLQADPEGEGSARADVIIEAIFEDKDAKQSLYKALWPRLQSHAILATNTSSIPLESLREGLPEPNRLIGLHFFNPVSMMPLVEVVYHAETPPELLARGAAFAQQIGKLPLAVKSGAGFLVNRVLAPYLIEALSMHKEGLSKEDIDEAALRFGMPVGPIELADVVGLDVCAKVAETLGDDAASTFVSDYVSRGQLGKKSGSGLYDWQKGKAVKADCSERSDWSALAQRLVQPLLDECLACEAEGVVASPELLDAGVIFGTGFAPFTGGPLHYMQSQQQGEKP